MGVGDAVAIAGEEEGEGSEDEDSGQREGVEEGAEILRSSDEAVGGDFSGSEGYGSGAGQRLGAGEVCEGGEDAKEGRDSGGKGIEEKRGADCESSERGGNNAHEAGEEIGDGANRELTDRCDGAHP